FLSWRPRSLPVRVDSNVDVPQMVYEHAVICEYAHARLRWLRDSTTETDRASGIPRIVGWRHGPAHPETWDDMGVFCWLVKTPLGPALNSCPGQVRGACGPRLAKAAPARSEATARAAARSNGD